MQKLLLQVAVDLPDDADPNEMDYRFTYDGKLLDSEILEFTEIPD